MIIADKKPIPGVAVEYNGIVYRSITEAMWAIVGDALGWELEHEPITDANRIPGVYYIPDFYSFTLDVFVEIKGSLPTDYAKQIALAGATGKQVLVLAGRPGMYSHRLVEPDGRIGEIISTERPHNHPRWPDAIRRIREVFPQWNPPIAQISIDGESTGRGWFTTRNPELDGFFHPTFGAGIVQETMDDQYGNTLLSAKFPGKGGTMRPVIVRADLVKFVDRRWSGWTRGATRSMDPAEYLWDRKTFYSDVDGRPWFFCRECERVCDVIAEGNRGDDIVVIRAHKVGEYGADGVFGRTHSLYDWAEFRLSLYCLDCTMRYESGMPSVMEVSL